MEEEVEVEEEEDRPGLAGLKWAEPTGTCLKDSEPPSGTQEKKLDEDVRTRVSLQVNPFS